MPNVCSQTAVISYCKIYDCNCTFAVPYCKHPVAKDGTYTRFCKHMIEQEAERKGGTVHPLDAWEIR